VVDISQMVISQPALRLIPPRSYRVFYSFGAPPVLFTQALRLQIPSPGSRATGLILWHARRV